MTTKPYRSMTREELAEATAEFDREFVADNFGHPTADARELWQRAKRKPGRPRLGKGVKVISVSLEKGLLDEADKLAKSKGVSRAGLIARGLRAVLAAERPRRPSMKRRAGS